MYAKIFLIISTAFYGACGAEPSGDTDKDAVSNNSDANNGQVQEPGSGSEGELGSGTESETNKNDNQGQTTTEGTYQKGAIFKNSDGLALNGYDPVAYFVASAPQMGNSQFSYQWENATWNFASQENLDKFKANPLAYAPQYGGFCAYGATYGGAVPTIPEAFDIVDGKLYLNASLSVQSNWQKDIQGNIVKANGNWANIVARQK